MAKSLKGEPSAQQVLLFGHIRAALDEELRARGWSVPELARKIGKKDSGIYYWVRGLGAPREENARKLSKLLGRPIADFMKRDPPSDAAPNKLSRALALIPETKKPEAPVAAAPQKVSSFTITDDGMARIVIDVTLPIERAWTLYKTLIDTGLIEKPRR